MSTPTPTLTIPLREYLELACNYREHANIDEARAKELKQIDPDEVYCHVQMPGDFKDMPQFEVRVPRLWRIECWRTEYCRQRQVKARSAAEREISCLSRELAGDVAKVLVAQLSLDEAEAFVLAKKLVEKDNDVFAKRFGIDLAELKAKRQALVEGK